MAEFSPAPTKNGEGSPKSRSILEVRPNARGTPIVLSVPLRKAIPSRTRISSSTRGTAVLSTLRLITILRISQPPSLCKYSIEYHLLGEQKRIERTRRELTGFLSRVEGLQIGSPICAVRLHQASAVREIDYGHDLAHVGSLVRVS